MLSSEKRIKALFNLLICIIWSVLLGCAYVTGIQNIRQTDNTNLNKDTEELTFMTFNIRAGGGIKNRGLSPHRVFASKENLIKIADAIKSADPDIVGLQEVRGYNQAKFLAEKLNMNFAYSTHAGSNWWGLSVLSNFKIIDIRTKLINSSLDNRIALMSMIDINGKIINVLNVHYALENYDGQVRATMKFLDKVEGPVVLLGDLNRKFYHKELKPIQEKLADTCLAVKTKETYDAEKLGTWYIPLTFRIDYIFINRRYFDVINAGLVPSGYRRVSDHVAYWTKLKLKK